MKNIIFMDVDGTLCGQDGSVPKSAKLAIEKTRAKGNQVYLCTGRSLPEITEDITSIGFDGIIGAGGGYIEINRKKIYHKLMGQEDVKRAVTYFEHHDICYYLESNDGIFFKDNCADFISEAAVKMSKIYPDRFEKDNPIPQWFIDIINENIGQDIDFDNINKISFISIRHPFDKSFEYFKNDYEVHHSTVFQYGPNSGELGIKGVTKYTAVKRVLDHLEEKAYKSFAFGDGLNDVDMFNAVDFAVAMENAKSGLKDVADAITDIAENDGVYKAFEKLNLI